MATSSRTGHTFKGWFTSASGGTQITAETRVAIDGDQTLYAHWEKIPYTVTLKNTDGMITTMTGGGTYYYGDSVTVKATPKAGYTESSYTTSGGTRYKKTHSYSFVKWTGSGVANSTNASYTFTMPAGNVTLTASGKDTTGSSGTQYYLTVNKGTGVASVTGAGWYNSGATATVGATYAAGYKASSGTGNYTMSSARTVTVTAERQIVGYALNCGLSEHTHTYSCTHKKCGSPLIKEPNQYQVGFIWRCTKNHTIPYDSSLTSCTHQIEVVCPIPEHTHSGSPTTGGGCYGTPIYAN